MTGHGPTKILVAASWEAMVGRSRQFDTDFTLAWIKALPPKA